MKARYQRCASAATSGLSSRMVGMVLAATLGIAAGGLATAAQAQVQTGAAAESGSKPNILMIMADDIGWLNVSAYNLGMMGYRTPNIDRIAAGGRALHRLVWRAELHRRARRLRHRAVADPHWSDQGRAAGGRHRPAGRRPLRRRGAEVARLRHRPVRQEPPRRQGRVPADQPRLRRVLRQPLPPQRRGGAGEPGLSEEPRVPRAVRATRRDQGHRGRADRGHRAADHQAHGDGRRGVPGRDARLHRPRDRRGHALVRLLQSDPDARLDASEAGVAGRDRARALPRRHGRARRLCRAAAAEARRPRHRRRHHRALHLRQRRRGR